MSPELEGETAACMAAINSGIVSDKRWSRTEMIEALEEIIASCDATIEAAREDERAGR